MFGLDSTIIMFVGLVAVAVFGLLWALMFNRVNTERNRERKINTIMRGKEGKNQRAQAELRRTDANKRRTTVQKSLKELEESTKEKNPNKISVKELLRQAGLPIDIRQFYIASVGFGIIFAGFVFLLSGNAILAGASLFIGILGIPRWFVGLMKKRRMNAFLEEFPNAVDVITRGIKSGLPLNDCMAIIAAEAKDPVREEFQKIIETQKIGVPMTEAVAKLYKNVPLVEANFFSIVLIIQQSSGGNVSEALANLSKILRDRKKMKAKIHAMSSEAKASAFIIGALPIIVTIMIYVTTPAYIALLFTEDTGNLILLGSGVWMMVGIIVMRQMINFDF